MPPTVKENEIQSAGLETAQRPSSTATLAGDAGIKQQPVALEIPVSVNGARTVEGSDKREPFSEATKTVLVFGSGAVIRLSSTVAPGQLLFLTNERTKKEVVCQVVKSKNYRNVSGYVELEFTESVVGFWGMRFPGDRIGSAPRPAVPGPVAVSSPAVSGSPVGPRPVAPVHATPAVNAVPHVAAPSVVVPKPVVPPSVIRAGEPRLSEAKSATPPPPLGQIPSVPAVEEPVEQKLVAPTARLSSSLSSSFDPAAPFNLPAATPFVPAVPVTPFAPVATIPEIRFNPAPEKIETPEPVTFDSPRVSESQASFLEPPKAFVPAPPTVNATIAPPVFETKPLLPEVAPHVPPAPTATDPETEALKQHTARLQEQLSSLLFSAPSAAPPAAPPLIAAQDSNAAPVFEKKEIAETAAKVLQVAQTFAATPEPVKSVTAPVTSKLDDEELEIPAWLAPLARNAAAPTSTQELIEREKVKRLAEQPKVEEIAAESVAVVEQRHLAELPLPMFGDELPTDGEKSTGERGSRRANNGGFIAAIAAVVLLVAGAGWWFLRPQSGGVHAGATPASNVPASVASIPGAASPTPSQRNASPSGSPAQTNSAAGNNHMAESNPAANSISVVPVASADRNSQPASNPLNSRTSAATAVSNQPVTAPEKKSNLGEVHLAAPLVTPNRKTQNGAEADPGIALANDEHPESSTGALNGGLAGGGKQPAAPVAPLPVGGDVTPARQISSVPPVYPSMARTQRISGNVVIDASIDVNGRVASMKVISGPVLLHQAAMDALKQWKYQPATLDGKPTAMHLNVTIQFRLQ